MLIDFERDVEYYFERRFRAYLAAVAQAVGVGIESCSIDVGTPAGAYIALDRRLPHYPGHDLALVWDERHGWALAVEDPCDGVNVLGYLGGHEVVPAPAAVVRFLMRAGDPATLVRKPPALRPAGSHENLLDHLPEAGPQPILN